jgi:hypothetical protein
VGRRLETGSLAKFRHSYERRAISQVDLDDCARMTEPIMSA